MTTDFKKISQQFLQSLDDLDRIRATSVGDFHRCPAGWRAKMLGEGHQKESPYAKRGTAVHLFIEQYLRGERGIPKSRDEFDWLGEEGVPPEECENLYDYLQTLEPLRPHLLDVEKQLTLGRCAHALPLTGRVDALFRYNDEGDVLILDHKTNRSFRGSDWWKLQPQPRIYAWLVRHLIPTARDVYFAIGYVNLGRRVVWHTDPADDAWAYERFTSLLDELRVYKRTGEWPERINSDCRYCPVKATCRTLHRANNQLGREFDELTDLEQYRRAMDTQKLFEAIAEELKERIVGRLADATGGEVVESGLRAILRTSQRRSVSFANAWEAVAPLCGMPSLPAHPGDWVTLEQIFNPQIGAIDKVATKHPTVAVNLEGKVVVTETTPSLIIEEITDERGDDRSNNTERS